MGRSPKSTLTDTGIQQTKKLAKRFTQNLSQIRPAVAVASSLVRCMKTAEIITQALQIDLHSENAFWELSKGEWEGRMPRPPPEPWISQLHKDPFGFRYPRGESYQDLQERTIPAFESWLKRFPERHLLFVIHGDVILSLMQHLMHFPKHRINDFELTPCCLTRFIQTPTSWVLHSFNDHSHLSYLID